MEIQMGVRNEKKTIRVDDMFYFVFGITPDANDENKIKQCVYKAYLDLCRTIDYKYSSAEIESWKKKNSSEEERNMAKEFEERKTEFKNTIVNIIIEAVNNKEFLDDFDCWHKNISERIKEK